MNRFVYIEMQTMYDSIQCLSGSSSVFTFRTHVRLVRSGDREHSVRQLQCQRRLVIMQVSAVYINGDQSENRTDDVDETVCHPV